MRIEQTAALAEAQPRIVDGEERLTAPGGGLALFVVAPGDAVSITDPEGMQPAVLRVLPRGRASADPVPALAEHRSARAAQDPGARALLASASGGEGDAGLLAGYTFFSSEGPAGDAVAFTAADHALCLLEAPGGPMMPDAQDAPTRLEIAIRRARSVAALPPPLAAPKLDLRVPAASARAYRVKKGDYIQIIDVEGKQCSDFLAFDAEALGEGREFGLDAATTRTLMGTAFSSPGLHSKYFDERQRPLVEVVRDTVGRHDTFMLACSSKYYDDMGYPGHDNCTDNFNRELAEYDIRPRAGWPAINFFYNTFVGADAAIGLDEPWSRPGDYVLLRALTDLVCASSSCADDIDPANGWNPTDIHVRVYDGAESFSPGMAHRMTSDAEPRLTRETGFHARTSALTRSFVDYKGFWLPQHFNGYGAIAEYWACRERAAVMDLSPLRKFEIVGPDAEALVQLAVTRDVTKLAIGQVVYTAICHDTGGMVDDATVFRLAAHNFRVVAGDDYAGVWLRELAEREGLNAWVRASTDQLHNIAVQGPRSREILAPIVATPPHLSTVAELGWFRFTVGKIDGIPVLVSRTGYSGELGYEIFCHPGKAPQVWDAVWAAGQPHGLAPLGLEALDMLRIEAGLAFAGYEFCDRTDPFEAGIGFTVPAKKTVRFIGSEALATRRASPLRKLVGLDVDGADDVHHGDPIFNGRLRIGEITSATRSQVLGKTIALARLDATAAEIGRRVEIGRLDGHQKRIGATIVRFPHYDPDKSRVRA